MSKLDEVRAIFVPGEKVSCTANTYFRAHDNEAKALKTWTVGKVGKSVWFPADDGGWRGTFPTRVSDVLHVDESSATWLIGRDDHTVTYQRHPMDEHRYCANCGHPEKDHGGPAGCDWEVSDWGTLDCGCMDFKNFRPADSSMESVVV